MCRGGLEEREREREREVVRVEVCMLLRLFKTKVPYGRWCLPPLAAAACPLAYFSNVALAAAPFLVRPPPLSLGRGHLLLQHGVDSLLRQLPVDLVVAPERAVVLDESLDLVRGVVLEDEVAPERELLLTGRRYCLDREEGGEAVELWELQGGRARDKLIFWFRV